MEEMQEINSRQRVYDFLVAFTKKNGYSPSIKEICKGTDLKSTSSVYYYLMMLEIMGMIHMKEHTPRAISLVGYEFVKVR